MARIHYRGFSLGEWVMSRCSAASYTCRATRTESHMIPPPPPLHTHAHTYTLFLEALRWSWWFQKDRRRRTPSGSPTITSPLPAAASNRPRVLPSFRPSQKSLQYFSKRKHLGVGGVLTGEEKVVLCWWWGGGGVEATVRRSQRASQCGVTWRCPWCWNLEMTLSTVLKCGEAEPPCTYSVHTVPCESWTHRSGEYPPSASDNMLAREVQYFSGITADEAHAAELLR